MIGAVAILILGTVAVSSAMASARVVMGCTHFSSGQELLSGVKAAPRDCGNPALGGSTAGIEGARWRDWGAPRATGTGHLVDGLGFQYPAHFTVYGRARRDGVTFYSRMHLVSTGEVRGSAYRPGLNKIVSVKPYGLATQSTMATHVIRVYRNFGVIQGLSVRPGVVTIAADGNDTITSLRGWGSWGAPTTSATGTNHVNNCQPSCANGRISRVPTTLVLSQRGFYRGHYVYECYALNPAPNRYLRRVCLP